MKCVRLSSNTRFFRAALVASITVFVGGCHSGVETPVSPSGGSASLPTATAAGTASDSVVAALKGGPLSFEMDEVDSSGYAGTCTLGTGGDGFRVKAVGHGNPNTLIRFILRDTATGYRYTDFVEVDQRGSFRTGQDRVTFFPSGLLVDCQLMPTDGSAAVLAQGPVFEIP